MQVKRKLCSHAIGVGVWEKKMQDKTTIRKLFDESDIQFAVPAYQRAYSWDVDSDKKQVKQFYQDLIDQIEFTKIEADQINRKTYFLGHFLFEKDSQNSNKYWIIDGQQRLTTVVIFMSVFISELNSRKENGEKLLDLDGKEIKLNRLRENYLVKDESIKFESVAYDNSDFCQIIYDNNKKVTPQSASIKRVLKAYKYFTKELNEQTTENLIKIKDTLDNTVVTTFEVDDKIQATQIFAFQNDRGKDLTSLEIIKAYIMHRVYSVSKDSKTAESDIKQIETIFSDIYKISEEISEDYSEDTVLNYHCTAFIALSGTSVERVKNWIQKLKSENINKEIKAFCNDLKESFITIKRLSELTNKNCSITDCLILNRNNSIPLFLKLFRFNEENEKEIQSIATQIENIIFKLTYTIADYRTNNLPGIALKYQGNIDQLKAELSEIQEKGFQSWWQFSKNCKAYFTKGTYHYKSRIQYVLWKYENFKRTEKKLHLITPIEFTNKFSVKKLENTIDHITPQEPNFMQYADKFKENFLNCIGNLALMTWGNNSQKSNNNPVKEIKKYDTDYISHQEIRDVLKTNKKWGEAEISERQKKIADFVIQNWKL